MTAIRCVAIGATVALLLLASGCIGHRRRAYRSPVRNAYVERQVHPDHLDRLGDSLAKQGRTAQAKEMYNLAARRRASAMRLVPPARTAARPHQSNPRAIPPAPVRNTRAPLVPAAPPAELPPPPEDKPDIPIINGRINSVPITTVRRIDPMSETNLPLKANLRPLRVSSNRAVTNVHIAANGHPQFRQPANLGSADQPHTIRIIPASKGSPVEVKEFRFGHPALMPDVPESRKSKAGEVKRTSVEMTINPRPKDLKADDNAMAWLSRIAGQPAKHAAQLAALLTHSSSEVRSLSAFLLGRCGDAAGQFCGELDAQVGAERNGPTRVRMAEALLRISAGHERAAAVLEEALESADRSVRWEAVCVANVLASEPASEVAVRRLIERLSDPDEKIRVMAALKLGEFPRLVKTSAPILEETVIRAHAQPELRTAALAALRVLRDPTRDLQVTARIAGQ